VSPTRRPTPPTSDAATPSTVTEVGLRVGDVVRFRRNDAGRWQEGRVVGREKDGSISVRDGKGAARALAVDRLEVRSKGPRGGVVWEAVTDRAARTEQLGLL
jgi:hypothetical protein